MTELIAAPIVLEAAGVPTKLISEFFGRLASNEKEISIAVMDSPCGWSEPGQRPEFDEYTVVIEGELVVEAEDSSLTVSAGQAARANAGACGCAIRPRGRRGPDTSRSACPRSRLIPSIGTNSC